MLLRHPWLAPLTKPETITEEEEDEGAIPTGEAEGTDEAGLKMHDAEVGQWVLSALERKRSGKLGSKAKPALHAAPLDTVSNSAPSPSTT